VVKLVFQDAIFNKGRVTNYNILKVREVHIRVSGPESESFTFTAVLAYTGLGEKIVLLKYSEHYGFWWYWVYDANGTRYEKKPV
jgi:hypothetical protein